MTWKSVFSGFTLFVFLGTFCLSAVPASAQRFKIRKSATGRVASNAERRAPRGNVANGEFQIHYLVNDERRRRSLGDLSWDDGLAALARSYSRQMARESFFSHYDPNGDSVVERAQNAGLRGWRKIGENLFFCEGYDSFETLAVRGWMSSPEHRKNILDRQFNGTGIGVAETRDGRIYITQIFIRG